MIRKLSTWVLFASMLFGTPLGAQTSTSRKSSQKPTTTDWDKRIQQYQALLNDVDVTSDPEVKHAVYLKWVEATCQNKRANVEKALGNSDAALATAVYSSCVKRLQGLESTGPTPGATATSVNPLTTAPAPPSNTLPNPELPEGCTSIPKRLDSDFKTDTPIRFPAPSTDAWKPDAGWVELNANSSGGEISTKSTVWLGYLNRLRYNATLGGNVTSIAAPTIPNSIFPTVTPVAASQPAENPNKTAAPLQGVAADFDRFNSCFQGMSTKFVAFQSRLSDEELLMNGVRDRIQNHINSLQPIVNTVEEARAAADSSMLPQDEIPAFPIGDLMQLRNLLTEFISKYAEFARWASSSSNSWNATEFQRVSAGAISIAQALDKYLALPLTSNANSRATNTSAVNSSGANAGTTTNRAQASGASTGDTRVSAVSQQATAPSNIDVGSEEVKDYEANREYINKWSDQFRKVATAPAGYFVVTYKPQCGGWFGQGTSTQMQLTVSDEMNPSQNPAPRNLDKVVCQSALTVTNGLGLSFIPDRTPAFVPSTNNGTNGSPVLGYSSEASVRPAYALQVNAALWSPRESNFEIHWSLGAMLTAVTGGATTDIIMGPAFSFKKRAFFISPVYDLGQRTVFQNGFSVGTAQGDLTSPPTRQTWKSGFGLTITFPLSPGSSTTNSSNSAGGSTTGTVGNGAGGNGNATKGR